MVPRKYGEMQSRFGDALLKKLSGLPIKRTGLQS